MADSTLPLNTGTGGKTLDTESLTGAGAVVVERQRLEVAGAALAEIARVMNSAPAGTEYALVVRPITDQSVLENIFLQMQRQTELLRAILAGATNGSLSDDELDALRST